MIKRIKVFTVIPVLSLLLACSKQTPDTSNLYSPDTPDVTSKATLAELQQGRTLYINNCGQCHGLHSPDEYSPNSWINVLGNMAPRTGMTAAQVNIVDKYLSRGK